MAEEGRSERIRALNDALRRGRGLGMIVTTRTVAALGEARVWEVRSAIARFEDFNEDNDPYGEHDFGIVEIDDLRVIWKIDYYANNLEEESADPADPTVTTRVMTIMLPEDW